MTMLLDAPPAIHERALCESSHLASPASIQLLKTTSALTMLKLDATSAMSGGNPQASQTEHVTCAAAAQVVKLNTAYLQSPTSEYSAKCRLHSHKLAEAEFALRNVALSTSRSDSLDVMYDHAARCARCAAGHT